MDRVIKVLREMSRPDAVYIRSELDQRSQELKASLFRSNGFLGISMSKSPVYTWLQNNLEMHQRSKSRFMDFLKLLQQGSMSLTPTGQGKVDSKKSWMEQDQSMLADMNAMTRLDSINLKSVPAATRQHEVVCQQLQEGYLKYKASRDYLGSAEFMCDMIDPFLNDTSDQIIAFCRGGKTFNSNVRSTIQDRYDRMKAKAGPRSLSMDEAGVLMNTKRKELKCPLPSVNTID